ncbi:hypothetical protein [Oryza sativa Japonica Group]|uniref:Uncharacterized protein P0013F10.27 n=1 Tax=Oryza sativa subsp. japonica TaxID=39947 RepID=Q5VRV4_ORYSJ|nr:hypothetical protein [Oryza sativa Japonica Group]
MPRAPSVSGAPARPAGVLWRSRCLSGLRGCVRIKNKKSVALILGIDSLDGQ